MIGRRFFFLVGAGAVDSHSGRVPASVTLDFGLYNVQPFPSVGESEEVEVPVSFLACIFSYYSTPYLLLSPRDANNFKNNAYYRVHRGTQGPFAKRFEPKRHHARLDLRFRSTDASTKAKPAPFFFFFSKATDELEQEDSMKLGLRRASLSFQQDQRPMLTVRCRSEGLRDRPI